MFRRVFPRVPFSPLRPTNSISTFSRSQQRSFTFTPYKMSDLTVDLTAPNGKKFTLPTGIFIDNEFVKSKSGEKITSINPTLATLPLSEFWLQDSANVNYDPAMRRKYAVSTQPAPTTSMSQSKQPGKPSTTLLGETYRPPTAAPSCLNSPT